MFSGSSSDECIFRHAIGHCFDDLVQSPIGMMSSLRLKSHRNPLLDIFVLINFSK